MHFFSQKNHKQKRTWMYDPLFRCWMNRRGTTSLVQLRPVLSTSYFLSQSHTPIISCRWVLGVGCLVSLQVMSIIQSVFLPACLYGYIVSLSTTALSMSCCPKQKRNSIAASYLILHHCHKLPKKNVVPAKVEAIESSVLIGDGFLACLSSSSPAVQHYRQLLVASSSTTHCLAMTSPMKPSPIWWILLFPPSEHLFGSAAVWMPFAYFLRISLVCRCASVSYPFS